jgi:glycerate kinase
MREVVRELQVPVDVACDVRNPLLGERGAARAFAPQKGASPTEVEELERRLAGMEELAPYADVPGAGAAGGLGAALASLGARLVPGAAAVLDLVGFDAARPALAVTGEGRVDGTTAAGKAPAEVARRCAAVGTPCVVFGGVVVEPVPDAETVALSGEPAQARADLVELGRRLGLRLLDAAR